MKLVKYLLILTAVITLSLTACGGRETNQIEETTAAEEATVAKETSADEETIADEESSKNQDTSETEETTNDSESISTKKDSSGVEITLPSSMLVGSTQEEIEAGVEETEFDDVTFNEDGSVTYKMSSDSHRELLESLKTGIDESIAEMLSDKETYPSFTEITYNDDFTEFIVMCDGSKYTDIESFSALNFYIQGWYYQALNGVQEDDLKVVVTYKDKDTNEVLDTGDSSLLGE